MTEGMKKCKWCATEIPNEAVVCPHCQKKVPYLPPSGQFKATTPSGRQLLFILVAGGLVAFLMVLAFLIAPAQSARPGKKTTISSSSSGTHAPDPALDQRIQNLLDSGMIMKIDNDSRYFYVNSEFWRMATVAQKQAISSDFYRYAQRNCKTTAWLEVYDGYSGKQLAKWNSWGFKLYP